jgi:hypothetical protein
MSKRFRADRAAALAAMLRQSGEDATATTVAPTRGLNGGCSDPDHCPQHSGQTANGEPMLTVKTHVSGSRLNKLAKSLFN